MFSPQVLTGLAEVAARYDALLCDVWGVVHDGQAPFAEACAALERFSAERGPVVLISNSPRPAAGVEAQLAQLRVPRAAWSALVTSGDVTRALLADRAPGPAWAIGPERDAPLYDGLGLSFTGPETASFIACTGPEDDDRETPEDYRDRLAVGVRRGLVMICANPDRMVQRGDRLIYCGGALADLYARMGGEVVMAGKPFAPIYDLALAEVEALRPSHDPGLVLAIGDGVATDLQGAAGRGLDSLFIAHGIHAADALGPDRRLDAERLGGLLAREGAQARFAMAALRW
jgi:HAD superfamily hydrolase (TIGR01459 family)